MDLPSSGRLYAQLHPQLHTRPSKEQDVLFVPLHEMDCFHPVHAKAVEFQKAQDVLYTKCSMLH